MKNSICFVLSLSALFLSACTSNDAEKFIGDWNGPVNCEGENQNVTLSISLGTEDNTVVVLLNGENSINATINGKDITLIPKTIDGETLEGTGSISDNETTMTFQFIITDDGIAEPCIGSFTK